MDEDMLLGAEDLKAKPKDVSECVASNGKKACKNCSCGLAEKLAGDEAATAAPTSACGSVSAPPNRGNYDARHVLSTFFLARR